MGLGAVYILLDEFAWTNTGLDRGDNARVLAELLPGPEASPHFEDPIVGPAGAKLLLGFMIWAGGRAA